MGQLGAQLAFPLGASAALDIDGKLLTGEIGTDLAAPIVVHYSPASFCLDLRNDHIAFSITDDVGPVVMIFISIKFEKSGIYETVFDGVQFVGRYKDSKQETISTGFRFTIIRNLGWVDNFSVRIKASDNSNKIGSITANFKVPAAPGLPPDRGVIGGGAVGRPTRFIGVNR